MTSKDVSIGINDLPDKKQQQIILNLNKVPDGLKIVDIDSLIKTLKQVTNEINDAYQKNPHDPRLRMEKMMAGKTDEQSVLGAGLKNMQNGGVHYGVQAGENLYAFSREGLEQLHQDLETSNKLQKQLLEALAKKDEPNNPQKRAAKQMLYKGQLGGHLKKMTDWTDKVKGKFKHTYYGVKKLGLTLLLGMQNAYKAFKGTLDKAYTDAKPIVPDQVKMQDRADYEPQEEDYGDTLSNEKQTNEQVEPRVQEEQTSEPEKQVQDTQTAKAPEEFNLFESLNGAGKTKAPTDAPTSKQPDAFEEAMIDDDDLPEDMGPSDEDAPVETDELEDSIDDLDPEILTELDNLQNRDAVPKETKNSQQGGEKEVKKQDPFYGVKQGFTCSLDDNQRFDKVLGRIGRKYGLTLDSKHYETQADNKKQQNVLMIQLNYPKAEAGENTKPIVLNLPMYNEDVQQLLKSNPKQMDLQQEMLNQIAKTMEQEYDKRPKNDELETSSDILLRSKLDHIYDTDDQALDMVAGEKQKQLLYAGDDALTSNKISANTTIGFTKDKDGNINRVTKGELDKGLNDVTSFLTGKNQYTKEQVSQIKDELGKELRHSILNGGQLSTNKLYNDYLINISDHVHTKENLVRRALHVNKTNQKRVQGIKNVNRLDPQYQRSVAFVDVDQNGALHPYMLGQFNQTAQAIIENSKLDFTDQEKQDLNQKLFAEMIDTINESKGVTNGINAVIDKYQEDKQAQNNLLKLSKESMKTKQDAEPNLVHQKNPAIIKDKEKDKETTHYQMIDDAEINEQEQREARLQK